MLCARAGHDVVGVERDDALRARIAAADLPYTEPGLDPRGLPLAATVGEVDAQVWVVAVGTTRSGRLESGAVDEVVAGICARGLPALLIIESTVPPGTSRRLAQQHRVGVAHCPERARPGEVFEDFARIPRLCGGVDAAATEAARAFYATLTDAPLITCTAEEAELAKLAENAAREVQIAFANELADAAQSLGLEPGRVIELANTHPRAEILRPGVGVGGHCLPMATRWFAERADGVTAAARRLHERRPAEVARRIAAGLEPGARIAVLGRTYRPDTAYAPLPDGSDPYGSPAVALVAELRAMGFDVIQWDPADPTGSREEAVAGAARVFDAVP